MSDKRKILVVDDSETMRDMASYTLENEGYDVVVAVDGLDALEMIEQNNFDLIITDINMPKLDGIELIRNAREIPKLKGVPILCLTTETGEDTKLAARSAGATGWIQKPFDPDRLIHAARKMCL